MRMPSNRRNDGRAFETQVEAILRVYESKGLMSVRKVDPPTKVIGGRVIFQANPFPDFIGAWTERGGRMIAFEAKSTLDARLEANGNRGITITQMRSLREWRNANAATFVLWEHRGVVKMVPDFRLRTLHEAHSKSIGWDDLEAFVVPAGTGYVTADFRSLMLKVWRDPVR